MKNVGRNNSKKQKHLLISFWNASKSFATTLPLLMGIILLLGLFRTFISKQMIQAVFTGTSLQDTLIGAVIGSIAAGNPVTSYIIGGELLKEGISLFAVTAFIVTWVTVGVVQFPAEAAILGKRFAVARNVLSFVLAILVSLATVVTLRIIQ